MNYLNWPTKASTNAKNVLLVHCWFFLLPSLSCTNLAARSSSCWGNRLKMRCTIYKKSNLFFFRCCCCFFCCFCPWWDGDGDDVVALGFALTIPSVRVCRWSSPLLRSLAFPIWCHLVAEGQQDEQHELGQRPQVRHYRTMCPPSGGGLVAMSVAIAQRRHSDARRSRRRRGGQLSLHLNCKKWMKRHGHF